MAEEELESIKESPSIKPPARRINFKLIFLILVVLLTLASIPLAVYLVKQRQEIRKKAVYPVCEPGGVQCECYPILFRPESDTHIPGNQNIDLMLKVENRGNQICHQRMVGEGYWCGDGGPCNRPEFREEAGDTTKDIYPGEEVTYNFSFRPKYCGKYQVDIHIIPDDQQSGGGSVVYVDPPCEEYQEPTPTPTPTPTLTPTPTPTPVYELSCKILKVYDENWDEISDLTTIAVGDTVRFLVEGLCDEPQGITDARFRVNQGEWLEPTGKKWGHFYLEYEIPAAGSYKIEAMVYNPAIGWR